MHVGQATEEMRRLTPEEPYQHHFCEPCANEDPRVNPLLEYGADAFNEELKVVSVTAEHIRVRLLRTQTQENPEELIFMTSRLPAKYAVVGEQFRLTCKREDLERLKPNS